MSSKKYPTLTYAEFLQGAKESTLKKIMHELGPKLRQEEKEMDRRQQEVWHKIKNKIVGS
ncbi:MAG: hypothetical protein V1860_02970 [bacterium]